jgi:hypothetical protein
MYELLKTGQQEYPLFFRLDGEAAERHGAIGYVRADYGKSGTEFWTTWFDNQAHLKTPAFKQEFNSVIDYVREVSESASRENGDGFQNHCLVNMRRPVTDTAVRFKIQTEAYSYYFRCQPRQGDYDFHCFCFDNRYLLPELAGKHNLPQRCYSVMSASGKLIIITRGESGYVECADSQIGREANRMFSDTANQVNGITRAQEEAMVAGSMFGWDTPAAKPWNYDQNGKPRPLHPPKNKDHER